MATKQSEKVPLGSGLVTLLLVGGFAYFVYSKIDQVTTPKPPPSAKELEDCKKDLLCWAKHNITSAALSCGNAIERQAKYAFEWKTTSFEWQYDRYLWGEEQHQSITYIGDQIRFQNVFGAMENMIYRCKFNIEANEVESVEVIPGQL